MLLCRLLVGQGRVAVIAMALCSQDRTDPLADQLADDLAFTWMFANTNWHHGGRGPVINPALHTNA